MNTRRGALSSSDLTAMQFVNSFKHILHYFTFFMFNFLSIKSLRSLHSIALIVDILHPAPVGGFNFLKRKSLKSPLSQNGREFALKILKLDFKC